MISFDFAANLEPLLKDTPGSFYFHKRRTKEGQEPKSRDSRFGPKILTPLKSRDSDLGSEVLRMT